MKKLFAVVLFICIGLPLLNAQGRPDHPLTLQEALSLMRSNNPALASGRAHLQALKGNVLTASLRHNPVLSSAAEDFSPTNFNSTYLSNSQEFTENVSQLIERGGKRRVRVENAEITNQVASDSYQDSERQLELQVKTAFVGMLLAKANADLAQQNLADYKKVVDLNAIRVQAGDISPTDFDRIRLQQAQFESDMLSAEQALAQARVQLQSLIGQTDFSPLFDVQGTLEVPSLNLTLAELQSDALANRPDYAAVRDSVQKAKSDLRLAAANGATDVSVGTEYKRNGPLNTFGFTFQVPLRIFDRNQGEKLRTNEELRASQYAEQAARLQVSADVKQAWDAYQSAQTRAQLYSTDYLQTARGVRDRMQFSYQNSGTSLLDYLDAIRSYRDVQLAAHAANAQLLTAIHQLSFATAMELLK